MERSRLRRVRAKRESQRAVVYLVLAIAIVIALIGWGVPWMARVAGLLITEDTGIDELEELVPTPPVFIDVPEATGSANITLEGFAQPGVEVVLVVNGSEEKRVLVDEAGVFEFESIQIEEGENRIKGYAVSMRGKESEVSKEYAIRIDRTPPELTLSAPPDGEVRRGQEGRVVNFEGLVGEEGVRVTIGERVAIVSTDGSFSLPYQLIEGEQEIEIKAVDRAANESKTKIKLKWEP